MPRRKPLLITQCLYRQLGGYRRGCMRRDRVEYEVPQKYNLLIIYVQIILTVTVSFLSNSPYLFSIRKVFSWCGRTYQCPYTAHRLYAASAYHVPVPSKAHMGRPHNEGSFLSYFDKLWTLFSIHFLFLFT